VSRCPDVRCLRFTLLRTDCSCGTRLLTPDSQLEDDLSLLLTIVVTTIVIVDITTDATIAITIVIIIITVATAPDFQPR
jgi:hypothetical protein